MPGEHVELRDHEPGEAVDAGGVAERHEVEPAGAPRAAGGGAELAADLADPLAELVVELGRERAGAHARGVGLGDPPDLVDRARPDAGAHARRARHGVRRGDERIGAVVDVEHRALGALEDHELAPVERAPGDRRGVRDVRLEPVAELHVVLGHRVQVELRVLRERPQHQALGLERRVDLLAQDLLVEQVLHPDAEPGRLVRVAGADAAPGGADLERPEPRLARLVEELVVRHDQVGVGGDAQAADVDPAAVQLARSPP